MALGPASKQGGGKRIGFGRRRQSNGGQYCGCSRLTGAWVEYVTKNSPVCLKGFSPNGGNRESFVFKEDRGQRRADRGRMGGREGNRFPRTEVIGGGERRQSGRQSGGTKWFSL